MKKPAAAPTTKRDRLDYLLKRFGEGLMSHATFWEQMKASNLTQDDIDDYCRTAPKT